MDTKSEALSVAYELVQQALESGMDYGDWARSHAVGVNLDSWDTVKQNLWAISNRLWERRRKELGQD